MQRLNKTQTSQLSVTGCNNLDSKNMFEFKKIIGKGGFGRVWKVVDKKTRKLYALKVMDKAKIITKKSVNSVLNEREILCKLEH